MEYIDKLKAICDFYDAILSTCAEHLAVMCNRQDIFIKFACEAVTGRDITREKLKLYKPPVDDPDDEPDDDPDIDYNADNTGARYPLYPEIGDIYEACSGGEYVVIGVSLDSAILKSLATGWTMTVHDLGKYANGKIDWSHSTDGHFEKTPLK